MKNLSTLVLALILLSITVPAQNDPEGQFLPDTWAKENNVIPPSPGAASLGNFGNVPVSYYTGSPSINVPLYTMGGQQVSLPIGLSYDVNSIKVATVPGWEGLGWSLSSGGVITRNVMGMPDMWGNYYDPDDAGLPAINSGFCYDYIPWQTLLTRISCGDIEVQSDVYNYSIPGYSGSFVILPNQEIVESEFTGFDITPYFTGINNTLEKFEIKDLEGRVYVFDAVEETHYTIDPNDEGPTPAQCLYNNNIFKFNSSWHLTSITSNDGSEQILFAYQDISSKTGESFYTGYTNLLTDDSKTYGGGGDQDPDNCCDDINDPPSFSGGAGFLNEPQIFYRKYLDTAILLLGGEEVEKITFMPSLVSGYTDGNYESSGIQLNSFLVKRKWQASTFSQTLRFDFSYSMAKGRLTLEQVQEWGYDYDESEWISKPPHVFEYEEGTLSPVSSNGFDHWGFDNGASGNTSLIPNIEVSCGIFIGGGANRDASHTSNHGLLSKITYPTKGYTVFSFEGHVAPATPLGDCQNGTSGNMEVGGYRIQSIMDYDKDHGLSSKRTYTYELADGTTSGILLHVPAYHTQQTSYFHRGTNFFGGGQPCQTSDYTCYSTTIFAMDWKHRWGPHIGYSRVVETIEDSGGDNIGWTVREFDNHPLGAGTPLFGKPGNGNMTRSEVRDNGGSLVQESINVYADPSTCPSPRCKSRNSYSAASRILQSNEILLCHHVIGPCPVSNDWRLPIGADPNLPSCAQSEIFVNKMDRRVREVYQAWLPLESQTVTEHFGGNTVTKTTEYFYGNNTVPYPTATVFHNSDGKEHRTETTYAEFTGKKVPVKVKQKVDGQLVGGIDQTMDTYGRPLAIHEILSDNTNLLRATIGGYNAYGRPTSYTYMSFPTETYTWMGGLLTQRQRLDWTWDYDYNERRLLFSFTDMDGQVTKFRYDGLLRLKRIIERESHFLHTDFEYHYSQPGNSNNYIRTTAHFPDFDDQVTEQTFDGLGRPLLTKQIGYGPNGETIFTEDLRYDEFGRVAQKVYMPDMKFGLTYTLPGYDDSPLRRVLSETYPDGNSVTTQYLAENNHYKTVSTDENGNATTVIADIIGRQLKVTDAMGGQTGFAYDDRGNLLTVLNPEVQQYQYTYDLRNRMTSKRVPGAECQFFFYDDANDLLLASQDGNLRLQDKWLALRYDAHGRVIETGFFAGGGTTPVCGMPFQPGPGFAPVPQDLLTTNTYDVLAASCAAPADPDILKGRLTATTARILENGGLTGWSGTEFCYDQYGRMTGQEVTTPYGQDSYSYAYNMADLLLTTDRDHNNGELNIPSQNTYDHAGRVTNLHFWGTMIAKMAYTTRDQLEFKRLGGNIGLADLNYLYNDRGWLTHINQMPFANTASLPNCAVTDPPTGSGPTRSCATCGDQTMSLAQLLKLRFSKKLNVDCFLSCGCGDTCSPSSVPCNGPSVPNTGGTVPAGYPISVFDIEKCDGSGEMVPENGIPGVLDNYAVRGRYEFRHPGQQFRVETPTEGLQVMTASGIMDLIGQGGDLDIKNGRDGACKQCDPGPPACDPAESAAQTASIPVVMANLAQSTADLTFPTNLVRVRLCGSTEMYLFEEELEHLAGNYLRLQEIEIRDAQQYLIHGNPPGRVSLPVFFLSRDVNDGLPINSYLPCGQNTCSEVDGKAYARSVGPSTIFSAYDGQAPYANPIPPYPGSENSFVDDGQVWEIKAQGSPEWEAEWDIGIPMPPDETLGHYEVTVLVPEFENTVCKLGLFDGNGFVPINGGLDFVTLNQHPFPMQPFVVLQPDQIPTPAQVANMKVAMYIGIKKITFDAVYVKYDRTGPCTRCDQPGPTCTAQEQADQQASLANIKTLAQGMTPASIPLPTALYRVRLCDGSEEYLLHHELDLLAGNYVILQVVEIIKPDDTFITQVAPGQSIVIPPPARDDLFALRLDYYQGDPHLLPGATGYRNGNIASMYWQVGGKDRQAYGFAYDPLDRLTTARYGEIRQGGQYTNKGNYDVDLTYDAIGNITTLKRKGVMGECDVNGQYYLDFGYIDDLTYTYDAAKERLIGMADAVALAKGFKAAQAGYSYEYQYDDNGNLTYDESKQAYIYYNHLNLPWKAVNSEGEVKWVYDAYGTKLQKTTGSASGGSSVTYLDGIEKHSGGDVFVYHPEGRYAQYADDPYFPNWRLEYSLRDHLGNNRVMISDLNGDGYIQLSASDWVGNIPYIAPEIIQEEQYYPFGMAMEGVRYEPYWAKKDAYGYNGKELNGDIGLGWMDYGARWYDASIGRWNGVDLLAEAYAPLSTYSYVLGNPVRLIDLLGLSPSNSLWGDDIAKEKREASQKRMDSNKEMIQKKYEQDETKQKWEAAIGVYFERKAEKQVVDAFNDYRIKKREGELSKIANNMADEEETYNPIMGVKSRDLYKDGYVEVGGIKVGYESLTTYHNRVSNYELQDIQFGNWGFYHSGSDEFNIMGRIIGDSPTGATPELAFIKMSADQQRALSLAHESHALSFAMRIIDKKYRGNVEKRTQILQWLRGLGAFDF